ncbi:Hypothetical protein FKW44_001483, partial [Caligus rogercresseyi]
RVASEMDSGRVDEDQEDDGEETTQGKELPSESQQRMESGLPLRNGKAVEQQETEDTARLMRVVGKKEIQHTDRTVQQSQNRRKWCQKVKEEMMWKQQLIKTEKAPGK